MVSTMASIVYPVSLVVAFAVAPASPRGSTSLLGGIRKTAIKLFHRAQTECLSKGTPAACWWVLQAELRHRTLRATARLVTFSQDRPARNEERCTLT